MSRVELEIYKGVWRKILARLEQLGISPAAYLSWHQQVEFELSHSPRELLVWVHDEQCHQLKLLTSMADRNFKVAWLIDWNRDAVPQRFVVGDCLIVEKDPLLAKNHNASEHRTEAPPEPEPRPPSGT